MTPDTRMAWCLGLALVLWAPAAFAMATGSLEIMTGGLTFVAALLFTWVGTGIAAAITESYKRNNEAVEDAKRQIRELEQRAEIRAERRRAADRHDSEKRDAS